ncbi:MAG: hypothetical protein ACQZ3N_07885 [cyanobacterium endosymbiont of Rhopalodia yunnanensis]
MQKLFQAEAVYLLISLNFLNFMPILIIFLEKLSAKIIDSGPIIKLDFPKDLLLVLVRSSPSFCILI